MIVIVFGWKKLPDAARSLGRSMRIFKSEVDELKRDSSSAASHDTVDGNVSEERRAPAQPQAAERVAPRPEDKFENRSTDQVTTSGDVGAAPSTESRTDVSDRA